MLSLRGIREGGTAVLVTLLAAGAAVGNPAAGSPALKRHLSEWIDLGVVEGLAVAVVDGDSVLCREFAGNASLSPVTPVTVNTVFDIQEAGAGLLALTAACLHVRGELSLDVTLRDVFPELRMNESLAPERITLRDLLGATHEIGGWGIPRALAMLGERDADVLLAAIARTSTRLREGPDSWLRGIVIGNLLAAIVLEEATGVPWPQLVTREVLQPLGMTGTVAGPVTVPAVHRARLYARDRINTPPALAAAEDVTPCDDVLHPLSGIHSTLGDMARWARAQLTRGVLDGRRVLPEAAYREIQAPHRDQVRNEGTFQPGLNATGLGLYRGGAGRSSFLASGAQHRRVTVFPERNAAVVVLSTHRGGNRNSGWFEASVTEQALREARPGTVPTRRTEDLARARSTIAARESAFEHMTEEDNARAAGPAPFPVAAYVGAFVHPELGTVLVRPGDRNGELDVRVRCLHAAGVPRPAGPRQREAILRTPEGPMRFQFYADGTAESIRWFGKVFGRADS